MHIQRTIAGEDHLLCGTQVHPGEAEDLASGHDLRGGPRLWRRAEPQRIGNDVQLATAKAVDHRRPAGLRGIRIRKPTCRKCTGPGEVAGEDARTVAAVAIAMDGRCAQHQGAQARLAGRAVARIKIDTAEYID
ncbi:MAG: hypothetical protein DI592_18320 [Stenotrophomonas maltophilia]|nr:MAG: hypothetical protein DI592_18320 [Stenotrophomonas maltophilia]